MTPPLTVRYCTTAAELRKYATIPGDNMIHMPLKIQYSRNTTWAEKVAMLPEYRKFKSMVMRDVCDKCGVGFVDSLSNTDNNLEVTIYRPGWEPRFIGVFPIKHLSHFEAWINEQSQKHGLKIETLNMNKCRVPQRP